MADSPGHLPPHSDGSEYGAGRAHRVDRLDETRAGLATAVAMLRAIGMAFWLSETERERAVASGSPVPD